MYPNGLELYRIVLNRCVCPMPLNRLYTPCIVVHVDLPTQFLVASKERNLHCNVHVATENKPPLGP